MIGGISLGPCINRLDQRLNTMTKSKMIVVWGDEDILKLSIEYFLSANEDWKVVSISNKAGLDELLLSAEATQQDIVVVYQACSNDPSNMLPQLLQDHPAIQVITISLENNAMEVYSKQKIMVRQASDLITVIKGGEKGTRIPNEPTNPHPSAL
jgi:hypothetical protein